MTGIIPDFCSIIRSLTGQHPNRGSVCRSTAVRLRISSTHGTFEVAECCYNTFDAMPPEHSYRNPDDSRPLQVERLTRVEVEVSGPDGRSASCELLEFGSLQRCYDWPMICRAPGENSDIFEALHIALAISEAPVHLEVLEVRVTPASESEIAAWQRHNERCRAIGLAIEAAQNGQREYTVRTVLIQERSRSFHVTADSWAEAVQKVREAHGYRFLDELRSSDERIEDIDGDALEILEFTPSNEFIEEVVRQASESDASPPLT